MKISNAVCVAVGLINHENIKYGMQYVSSKSILLRRNGRMGVDSSQRELFDLNKKKGKLMTCGSGSGAIILCTIYPRGEL